jgi:hypothetical protein
MVIVVRIHAGEPPFGFDNLEDDCSVDVLFCTDGSAQCAREAAELIESPRRSAWGMDSKVEIHAEIDLAENQRRHWPLDTERGKTSDRQAATVSHSGTVRRCQENRFNWISSSDGEPTFPKRKI